MSSVCLSDMPSRSSIINESRSHHCLIFDASNVVTFNARSLKNKLTELQYLLYNVFDTVDVICITETWLSSSITNSMIDPLSQFNIYRRDRITKTTGGGVCILIHKKLNVVEVQISREFGLIECVCIDILCCFDSTIRLFNVYIDPVERQRRIFLS